MSQQFDDGVYGVRKAVDMVVDAVSKGGPVGARYSLILTMVEQEARWPNMRVTNKGNGAIASIKREWGIMRNTRRAKVPVIMSVILSLAKLQIEHNAENHA